MSEPTAQRTLVKSPPELWAELSDVECLARHLGEFGEIRITRVEPETTVVWEGERASGTVELEPSGWGTRVTLTATPAPDPAAEPVAEPEPVAATAAAEPDVHPLPAGREETDARDGDAPADPADAPAPATAQELLQRSGFFSRMLRRRRPAQPAADIGGPPAPTPDPAPPAPGPTPLPDPPAPEPEPPVTDPPPPAPTPLPPREPDPEPPAAARAGPGALDVEAVLSNVLDTLGAAHHRPFSR